MIDQNQTSTNPIPDKGPLLEQRARQDQSLPAGLASASAAQPQQITPSYPTWPTSKPGPHKTLPATGMRPINALRPEQLEEVNYNQETGEPAIPGDELTAEATLDAQTPLIPLKKGKQRRS